MILRMRQIQRWGRCEGTIEKELLNDVTSVGLPNLPLLLARLPAAELGFLVRCGFLQSVGISWVNSKVLLRVRSICGCCGALDFLRSFVDWRASSHILLRRLDTPTMELSLWEKKYHANKVQSSQARRKPPEIAPSDVSCHRS